MYTQKSIQPITWQRLYALRYHSQDNLPKFKLSIRMGDIKCAMVVGAMPCSGNCWSTGIFTHNHLQDLWI